MNTNQNVESGKFEESLKTKNQIKKEKRNVTTVGSKKKEELDGEKLTTRLTNEDPTIIPEPILDKTLLKEETKKEPNNENINKEIEEIDKYKDFVYNPYAGIPDSIKSDVYRLENEAINECNKNGTMSSLMDNTRVGHIRLKLEEHRTELETSNKELANFDILGFLNERDIEGKYTQEEMTYVMSKNFDWFQVNGTLLRNRGNVIGTSGRTMPTGQHYVVCTIKQFADIIAYKPDGLNHGRHKASYFDKSNKTWYGKNINRFNLSRFIIDYADGKVARMSGLPSLTLGEKTELRTLANDYSKFDTAPTEKTGRKPKVRNK